VSKSLDYVKNYYGVPAKVGMRVKVDGEMGTITCGDGQYIKVRIDGEKISANCHPTWEVVYYDHDGKVLMDTCTPKSA
jgi:hypothetical protein